MTRFYTADTHFGHARTLELCDRPYRSISDMNEHILAQAWNVVGVDDELWVLGDLALGPIEESLQTAARLPGRKTLILGNHDRPFNERTEERRARAHAMYTAAGFTIAETLTIKDVIAGHPVLLSHYPYTGDSHSKEDRFASVRAVDKGLPIIHGHVHETWHQRGREYNVGVDVNGFAPVSENTLAAWLDSLPAPTRRN